MRKTNKMLDNEREGKAMEILFFDDFSDDVRVDYYMADLLVENGFMKSSEKAFVEMVNTRGYYTEYLSPNVFVVCDPTGFIMGKRIRSCR